MKRLDGMGGGSQILEGSTYIQVKFGDLVDICWENSLKVTIALCTYIFRNFEIVVAFFKGLGLNNKTDYFKRYTEVLRYPSP